ncbi:hypothetical protein GGR26_003093 [Lewinella marina]|uniref:Uncharacterized protein n=1 Tax=Neolewinella marina TaxID=438751 RepID=A0A2G0CEM2_9BACT|nr:hypothetical protein [Neolewinella marina]NJB87313.1 hypothetical protein [Neolewinella marina]PHK98367.1 hypothetical protein CGL56_11765 [Neolewinella marina]
MIRYLPLLLCLWLAGCREEAINPRVLIEERAAEQVAAIRANLLRDCERKVQEAATARADSLLLDRARKMRRIAGRPPRPGRPGEPPPPQLSKPLPLRPLFPFEIRFDTLLRDSLLQDSLRRDSLLQDSLRVIDRLE